MFDTSNSLYWRWRTGTCPSGLDPDLYRYKKQDPDPPLTNADRKHTESVNIFVKTIGTQFIDYQCPAPTFLGIFFLSFRDCVQVQRVLLRQQECGHAAHAQEEEAWRAADQLRHVRL